MQSTHDLHQQYQRAMQAQRDAYRESPAKFPIKQLWWGMFLMMIGLLALFWLFFIEPITPKKGTMPDWVKRSLKPKTEEEEEPELSEQEPPYSMKPKGLNGHSLRHKTNEADEEDTEETQE